MSAKTGNKYVKYTSYERFMIGVYRDLDKVIKRELEKLRREDLNPTCAEGCSFCCRQKIPLTLPEAHIIAQYIKRNFSGGQRDEFRKRMSAWFAWVRDELPKYGNTKEDERAAYYDHSPYCPLLVDRKCSIYPVRPFACRTHYSSSSMDNCRSFTALVNAPDKHTMLHTIRNASIPFASSILQSIEAQGVNAEETASLLPQGVAMELGWGDLIPET